jgi:hypothetical protein
VRGIPRRTRATVTVAGVAKNGLTGRATRKLVA